MNINPCGWLQVAYILTSYYSKSHVSSLFCFDNFYDFLRSCDLLLSKSWTNFPLNCAITMAALTPYSYATAVTRVAYTPEDAQSYLVELGYPSVVGIDLEWNSKDPGATDHRVDVVQVSSLTMVVIMHIANNRGTSITLDYHANIF